MLLDLPPIVAASARQTFIFQLSALTLRQLTLCLFRKAGNIDTFSDGSDSKWMPILLAGKEETRLVFRDARAANQTSLSTCRWAISRWPT
jgi:hypothetical protein